MSRKGVPMLPPRWLDCPRMGDMIIDIFIPFKTPLGPLYDHFIDPGKIFHVEDAFKCVEPYKIGLVVDLTKSRRFYDRRDVTDNNCKYVKIECKGNEETPTPEQVNLFIQVVNQFLDSNSGNEKIGVHCTHGFNRTGFLIIAYLVEELNYGVDIAVQIFADARPPGIYKSDYLEDLFVRYGCKEDCPAAPALPSWCLDDKADCQRLSGSKRPHSDDVAGQNSDMTAKISRLDDDDDGEEQTVAPSKFASRKYPPPPPGNPQFVEGVPKVETLDQDCAEAHEARDLADRLCKLGGFVYSEGRLVSASDNYDDDQDGGQQDAEEGSHSHERVKVSKRPLGFRGSQPVSITQRNVLALVNSDYCVSYKADGTRFLLLIKGPNQVYLIDRANFVYKPDTLHFPTVAWVKEHEQSGAPANPSEFLTDPGGHICYTLADGELVLCHDLSKPPNITGSEVPGTPRFLLYDLVAFNNQSVGRLPFFERYTMIDKQIIWPRNTGGHLGLVDFGIQSFSVRRKVFRPLHQTEEFLKPSFAQTLDHATDGLIFQPCGPEDYYVLGTCPQTLKWKPPNLNTIDFRCKMEFERKTGEIPGYVGYLYLGGLTVPSAKLAHVSAKDKDLNGKICECVCVPGLGWKVLRIRTDKTEPNHHTSGVAIIESIMYPVTADQLMLCVRQRQSKVQHHHHHHQQQQQQQQQASCSRTQTDMVKNSF